MKFIPHLVFLLTVCSLIADEKAEKLLNLAGFTSHSSKNLQLNGFGSGFAVTSDGYVITASHVTEGSDAVRVIFKDGKSYDAKVVKEERGLDLAILKIEAKTPAFLSVSSRTAGLGDDIYTIGYPSPLLLGTNQKFTKGSISALTGLKNDSFRYQISVPIQPGNSGGAVVSEETGEVVGIVVSSLKGKEVVGFNPQNVNYAMKSGFIRPIMDALEIQSEKVKAAVSKNERRQRVVDAACMIVTAGESKLPKKDFTIQSLKMEMIWVKPGTFIMGSSDSEGLRVDNETQHKVALTKGYYLGKYEVTQAQWERVMGNNPSGYKGAFRPVEQVSWDDVVEFCKKLTEMEKKVGRVPEGMAYQLPTEAQWEYACRAGTTTAYSWGNFISSKNASYSRGLVDGTTPVGKYSANPWGFHDMHGNVYEWCADWHGTYPSGSLTNPEGPASGLQRVIRGGSWLAGETNLRSAERIKALVARTDNYGFRVSLRASK